MLQEISTEQFEAILESPQTVKKAIRKRERKDFLTDNPKKTRMNENQPYEYMLDDFKNIIEKGKGAKIAVVIDWLSVLYTFDDEAFAPARNEDESRQINDRITVRYYGKGNEHFKNIWHILFDGEHVATLLSHTRNPKFVRNGVCKIDFKNHLLYSQNLWPVYFHIEHALQLRYKNVSRLDIAIDGLNYLLEFVNAYVRQTADNKVVEMKGRPKVNSKVLDRRKMLYQNFQIGHAGSQKMVTIYNKSLDIVKTGKAYIQDYWIKNGIAREVLPIEVLGKAINGETTYLDGYENVFRYEIRLKGSKVLEMQDFNITWLCNVNTLMSLVKRHNENFFDFVFYQHSNVSKCPNCNLFPYELYDIQPIKLTRIKPKDDLYKTKLSIKKNVRQLFLKNLLPDDYIVTGMMVFDIKNFELEKWYKDRLPTWINEFEAIQPDKDYTEVVKKLLMDIQTQTLK